MRLFFIALASAAFVAAAGHPLSAFEGYKLLKLEGHQVKWGAPKLGAGAVATYGFVSQPVRFPDARNCGGMVPVNGLLSRLRIAPRTFRAETEAAFALWSRAANITFKPAAPGASADILIGVQSEPRGRAFANVAYEAKGHGPQSIDQALICLNPREKWKVGFDGDVDVYDLRYTIAHEIGHAIGLDHPPGEGEEELMGFRYEERFRAPQPGDVKGAVALSGSRMLAGNGPGPQAAAGGPDHDAPATDASAETPQLSLGRSPAPPAWPKTLGPITSP